MRPACWRRSRPIMTAFLGQPPASMREARRDRTKLEPTTSEFRRSGRPADVQGRLNQSHSLDPGAAAMSAPRSSLLCAISAICGLHGQGPHALAKRATEERATEDLKPTKECERLKHRYHGAGDRDGAERCGSSAHATLAL